MYANLGKYNLPHPEAVFDIHFFRENPQPFGMITVVLTMCNIFLTPSAALLAKELYPGNFAPTACHFFFALLEKKGVLRRCFTQNIDTLEVQFSQLTLPLHQFLSRDLFACFTLGLVSFSLC